MTTKRQTKRILITGGRAPVALEWCRLLHAAGHEVYVAESFPTPLCRYSKSVRKSYTVPAPRRQPVAFMAELERIVQDEQINLLLPTCEEIFHIAGGLEQLERHVAVLSPTLEQLHRLHHKGDFIELVRSAGLAVPDTMLLTSAQQWIDIQRDARENGMAMVLKPAYSRFASQVWLPPQDWMEKQDAYRSDSEVDQVQGKESGKSEGTGSLEQPEFTVRGSMLMRELEPLVETRIAVKEGSSARQWNEMSSLNAPAPYTLSPQQPWIAQQFISGEQLCTYSIVHEGVIVAHTTYRCRYRNSRAGASVHFEALERPDTLAWVQTLVQSWNGRQSTGSGLSSHVAEGRSSRFSGQLSFDLIEQAHTGTLYPLECNPRATSGVHLFRPEDGLEQALFDPDSLVASDQIIQPQPGRRVMLTLPMLVSGIGRRWNRQQWSQWRQSLRGTRDAVYRRNDPMPAYGQLRLLWTAWRISRREHLSIVEALTHDIEWNGRTEVDDI